MPNIEITTRFSKKFLSDVSDGELKASQRDTIKKRFGITGHFQQTIFRTGDPEGMGDLVEKDEIAIKAVTFISDEQYKKLEQDLKQP